MSDMPQGHVQNALYELANNDNFVDVTFGENIKVPGTKGGYEKSSQKR